MALNVTFMGRNFVVFFVKELVHWFRSRSSALNISRMLVQPPTTPIPTPATSDPETPRPTLPVDMVFNEGHLIAIAVYSTLMVVSAVGNVTVLITILRRSNGKRLTRVNLMLFHLAIADLLVTFLLMPLEIGWAYTVSWWAGDAFCRIASFFRIFGLYLSGFVLICISVDRLFAVTNPLHSVGTADIRGRRMLAVAWLMSAFCSAPQSFIFHVETHPNYTDYKQCVTFHSFPNRELEVAYSMFGNIVMYIIPLIVISFCYASIFRELSKKSMEHQGRAVEREATHESELNAVPPGHRRSASHVLTIFYLLGNTGGETRRAENNVRRSSSGNLCRAKTRTLHMTFVTVLVFFFCWTPYNIMSF
ncbi:hypothetical protein J437_LFUL000958 [Ladona fulva]|uniref:G-protein coupled receptors family 1 profile domain-containing protein n=1 Tax=Ladona fulva TaxID=123851 RepID=A0A8K0K855_LADFU|nr:hypothetical protein J437_LFUL000958 [Ladona fulva]